MTACASSCGLTDEDISELARTKLNYAEPGERVFVDTSSR